MQQFFRNYSLELSLPGSNATPVFQFGSERRNQELTHFAYLDLYEGYTVYTHISPYYYAHNTIELMDLRLVHNMKHGLRSGDWGEDKRKTLVIAFSVRLERLNRPIVDLSGFETLGFKLDVLKVDVVVGGDDEAGDSVKCLFPIMKAEVKSLGVYLVGNGTSLKVTHGLVEDAENFSHWRFEVS
jgi:hypothetical protein